MTTVLNGERLKSIAHANSTAEVVATALALRQRQRTETNVKAMWSSLLRNKEKVVQKEFFQFWKNLEAEGLGSLIVGRRGKHTRFIWNYSLKNVGKSMLEGSDIETNKIGKEVTQIEAKKPHSEHKRRGRPKGSKNKPKVGGSPAKILKEIPAAPTGKIIFVALRRDFNVEINLPVDVRENELNTIYTALRRAV